MAALLFVRRMAESVNVAVDDEGELPQQLSDASEAVPGIGANTASSTDTANMNDVVVFVIDGPFFFGAAEKLEGTLMHIQRKARVLILRMGRVPFIDATGIFALEEMVRSFQRHGSPILLCELRSNVQLKLERAGVIASVGTECVFDTLEQAKAAASAVPDERS